MSALFQLVFVLFVTVDCNVDFYIHEWIMDVHNMSTANGQQVGGYDIENEIFYTLGGYPAAYFGTPYEYTYDIKTGIFEANQSISPLKLFDEGGCQSYTTFTTINGSFIYFTNSNQYAPHTQYRSNFFQFDMQSNIITQNGITYPKPTASFMECYTNDAQRYIYVIGGYTSEDGIYFDRIHNFSIFNIIQNKWTVGPSLNIARQSAGCIYIENILYVFGGDNDGIIYNNTIEILSNPSAVRSNNTWTVLNTSIMDEYMTNPFAFYPHSNSNTIFIWGGSVGDYWSCHKFNFHTYKVSKCNVLPLVWTTSALTVYGYIENEYRFYLFGGFVGSFVQEELRNTIQIGVLHWCSWTANDAQNTLDLSYLDGTSIVASSNTNPLLLYRYSPCSNRMKCNGVSEMVDIVNKTSNDCNRYLAIWNNTDFESGLEYNVLNKHWTFTYKNGICTHPMQSVLKITWSCNPNITSYQVISAKSVGQCQDAIDIESVHACN